jgi:hypothetical protein
VGALLRALRCGRNNADAARRGAAPPRGGGGGGGGSGGDSGDSDGSDGSDATTDFEIPPWLGRGGLVVSGSDDGGAWVYCRSSGVALAALPADADVCNAVRPHPTLPLLATSGIESTVRLWRCGGFGDGRARGGGGGGGGGGGAPEPADGGSSGSGGDDSPPRRGPPQAPASALEARLGVGTRRLRERAAANAGLPEGAVYDRTFAGGRRGAGGNLHAMLGALPRVMDARTLQLLAQQEGECLVV